MKRNKNILSILLVLIMIAIGLTACSQAEKQVKLKFELDNNIAPRDERTYAAAHIKSIKLNNEKNDPIDIYIDLDEMKILNEESQEDEILLKPGNYNLSYSSYIDKEGKIFEITGPSELTINPQENEYIVNLAVKKLENKSYEEKEKGISNIEEFEKNANLNLLLDADKKRLESIKEEIEAKKQELAKKEKVFQEYKKVLEDPKSYIEVEDPDVEFLYSIYNISNTDIPQLFLSHFNKHFNKNIISMAYIDTNSDELKIIDPFGNEGARAGIGFYDGGFVRTYISGSGNYEEYHMKLIDNKIEEELMRAFHMNDKDIPEPFEIEKIDWIDINNLSTLYEKFERSEAEIANAKKEYEKKLQEKKIKIIEEAKSKGNIILEGTIHYLKNNEEMLEFQGKEDPNKAYGHSPDYGPYTIIVLDRETEYKRYSPDGETGNRTATMVQLWDVDGEKFQGKKVIAVTDEDFLSWPTDSSIPLGVPGINCIEIYENE